MKGSTKKVLIGGLLLLTLATLLGFYAFSLVAPEDRPAYKVYKNLAYGPYNAKGGNLLDIYVPKADATGDSSKTESNTTKSNPKSNHDTKPLVIWIHGGAWRMGEKTPFPGEFLVQNGFVVASINYRLTGEAKFPAQLDDCCAAITWLKKHAQEYQIDPTRIGVWGGSAGGHLVALLGTISGTSTHQPLVQAVADWCGITDLISVRRQAGADCRLDYQSAKGPVGLLLGGMPQQKLDLAKAASPALLVKAGDPPFLIVHGDQDDIVPIAQSKELYAALQKAGVESQLLIVPGEGHSMHGEEPYIATLQFFQRELLRQ